METNSAVTVRSDGAGVPGYIDFDVATSSVDDETTLRVVGELDCSTSPQLEAALATAVAGGTPFVDSTGLSVLVGGLKRLREEGGTMVVRSPRESTLRLFELTGLDAVFDVS